MLLLLGNSAAQAGGTCQEPVTTGTATVVHIENICFKPTVISIEAGGTVLWMNDLSKAPHTITGVNGLFGSDGQLDPGASFGHQFTTAGIYSYYCLLHRGMAGTVIVSERTAGLENVSLTSGALRSGTTPAVTDSSNDFGRLGLFVALAAGAATVAAAGGFALGARRAGR
jgi:plastocyanin